jgi:radical SAM superfamily enzyme YgiQ (UPF0313 family)
LVPSCWRAVSSRGCSFRCTFCQTTAFAPHPKDISLESIDRVLRFYVQHGVHFVLMLDENFGNLPAHSEEVIKSLATKFAGWCNRAWICSFAISRSGGNAEWKARCLESRASIRTS